VGVNISAPLSRRLASEAVERNCQQKFAGIDWRADYTESVKLGEALATSILRDQRACYNEAFSGFTFTKFDGTTVTI